MFGLKNNEKIYLRGYSDGFNNNHLNAKPQFIGPAFNLISDSESATVVKEFEITDTFESTDSYNVGFNDLTFVDDIKTKLNVVYNSIDGKTVNIDLSKNLIPERTGLFDDGFMIISFKYNGKTYEFDYRNEMGYPIATGSILDEKIGVVKNPTEWNSYGVDKEEIISTYYGKTLELSGTVNVYPEKAWKNKVFTFENVSDESYLISLNNLMNDTSHKIFNIACTLDDATGLGSFTPYDGINDYKLTVNFIGITEDDLTTKNLINIVNTMREYPGITVNFLPKAIIPPPEDASLNWTYTVDDSNNSINLTKYNGTDTDVKIKNKYSADGKIYNNVILSKNLFTSKSAITSVSFESGIKSSSDLSYMFYGCTSLNNIDFNDFDTSSNTTMKSMFTFCSGLTEINLNNLNTSSVKDMSSMFSSCSGLTEIDLNNLNTSNVKDMSGLFYNCTGLKYVSFEGLDLREVTNMSRLFYNCTALESIDFLFDSVSNLTNIKEIFKGCSNLTGVDLGNFDATTASGTSPVSGCTKLKTMCVDDEESRTIAMTAFGLSNSSSVKVAVGRLKDYIIPQEIIDNWTYTSDASTKTLTLKSYIGNEDEIVVKNKYSGFENVIIAGSTAISGAKPFDSVKSTLKSVIFDAGVKFTNYIQAMFQDFTMLENVDISKTNITEITGGINAMFNGCTALTYIDISDWDTSKVTVMNDLFNGCTNLKKVEARNLDFTSSTEYVLYNMFFDCSALDEVDVSGWNTTPITNIGSVFYGCSSLRTLDISDWDLSNVTKKMNIFANCSNLNVYVKDETAKNVIETSENLPSTVVAIVGKPE